MKAILESIRHCHYGVNSRILVTFVRWTYYIQQTSHHGIKRTEWTLLLWSQYLNRTVLPTMETRIEHCRHSHYDANIRVNHGLQQTLPLQSQDLNLLDSLMLQQILKDIGYPYRGINFSIQYTLPMWSQYENIAHYGVDITYKRHPHHGSMFENEKHSKLWSQHRNSHYSVNNRI